MTTMLEVLTKHTCLSADGEGDVQCACGKLFLVEDENERTHSNHVSEELEAAGFGDMEKSWDDGYRRAEDDHYGTGFWQQGMRGNPYQRQKRSGLR